MNDDERRDEPREPEVSFGSSPGPDAAAQPPQPSPEQPSTAADAPAAGPGDAPQTPESADVGDDGVLDVEVTDDDEPELTGRPQAAEQPAWAPPSYAYAGPPQGPPPAGPQQWAYGPPPEAPRRGMSGCVLAILIALGVLVVGGIIATMVTGLISTAEAPGAFGGGGDRVAVIFVNGIIADGGDAPSLFGPASLGSRAIMSQLRQAGKDKSVKAVMVRINSPGGSAAASAAIYEEIARLRKDHEKPVIASMGDTAASGGYYVASAADTIVANRATLTGSIGVIMQSINWSGLAEKYGVTSNTIVSGPYKDGMSPMRAMREEERVLYQALVDDVYNQFVDDVSKGRKKLTRAKVKKLADGRVFTGKQAKKLGLVDEIGNYHDALAIAAKAGGIKGEPNVKTYGRSRGLYGFLSEGLSGANSNPLAQAVPVPKPLGPGIWMIWEGNQTLEAK